MDTQMASSKKIGLKNRQKHSSPLYRQSRFNEGYLKIYAIGTLRQIHGRGSPVHAGVALWTTSGGTYKCDSVVCLGEDGGLEVERQED